MNEQILKRIREAGIRIYQRSYEDGYYLARWWEDLHSTGDIHKLLCRTHHTLPDFLDLFAPPTILAYTLDRNDCIDIAAWFVHTTSSAQCLWFSSWAAEPTRGTRKHLRIMHIIYDGLFTVSDVVIGLTKQPDLSKIHQHIGYTMTGSIPHYFDGETGYIWYLTQDRYESSKFKRVAGRL